MFALRISLFVLALAATTSLSCAAKDTIGGAKKQTIPGGVSHINLDDPAVLEASNFAVASISADSGSSNQLGLFKVVSATRQVVSGALYTITLQAAKTSCTKDQVKAASGATTGCTIDPKDTTKDHPDFGEFTVKVWDQPWLTPRFKVTSVVPKK